MKFILAATTTLFLLTSAQASPVPPDAKSDIMAFLEGVETVGSAIDEKSAGWISSLIVITNSDLEQEYKYEVSWWEVFGQLLVAKAFLDELDKGNYKEATEIAGSYITKKVIGKTAAGSAALGASRLAGIGTLAVDVYLNSFADMMDNRGVARQTELYVRARAYISHDQIMAGKDTDVVEFDTVDHYIWSVDEFQPFAPAPTIRIDRDLLLEFIGAAYDANVLKKRLNREIEDRYEEFLESVVARRLSESQSDPEPDDFAGSEGGSLGGAASGTSSQTVEPKLSPQTHPQRWGPDIVWPDWPPKGTCPDTNARACFEAAGVPEPALEFTFRVGQTSTSTGQATEFFELGEIDFARLQPKFRERGAEPLEPAVASSTVLLNGVPDIILPGITPDPGTTFADSSSQIGLGSNPEAFLVATEISAHRRLPDGTQRFVVTETFVTPPHAVKPALGFAYSYLDFFPGIRAPERRAVGLIFQDSSESLDRLPDIIRSDPNQLQKWLNALGYNAGEMDGVPGPQTRRALMEFQVEHCLVSTGQPDLATAKAIQVLARDSFNRNGLQYEQCAMAAMGGSASEKSSQPVEPKLSPLQNYSAPDGYLWAQLASRRTVEEARSFAAEMGEQARIFRTQNGWHTITGALLFESESLLDMIADEGWPSDSLLTRGESFIEELPLDPAGPPPTPAFTHTQTLRATEVLWFSWDEGIRTVYDTRPLKQGENVVVWGGPDEEGYCRGGGGEGAVLTCADLAAFAESAERDGN